MSEIPTQRPDVTLAELMGFVAENFRFTPADYYNLPKDREALQLFAIRHCILHQSKSLGVLSGAAESSDHLGEYDLSLDAEARAAVAKMLVNTLRLATLLCMKPSELAARVPQVMKSAN